MGRACSICVRADREAIDAALVSGEPNRQVAARLGLTESAVRRHKAEHIPLALVRAQDALEAASATDLLAQVQKLQDRTLAILAKAEERRDYRVALQAIREVRGNLELFARMVAAAVLNEQQQASKHRLGRGPYDTLPQTALTVIDCEIDRLEAELGR